MSDLVALETVLPDTPQELAKFVLVGREQLTAVRAEIRAIDKVRLAQEVRDQKMEEARMLSEALLDAEVKLGEMTKNIPKASGGDHRSQVFKNDSGVDFEKQVKSKKEVIHDLGFTPKQVERFEKLADNKDLVELAKVQARENDDIPTRTQVLSMAQARQRKYDQDMHRIDTDYQSVKLFHDAIYGVLGLPDDAGTVQSFIRGVDNYILMYIENIDEAITRLRTLKTKIQIERSKHGKK